VSETHVIFLPSPCLLAVLESLSSTAAHILLSWLFYGIILALPVVSISGGVLCWARRNTPTAAV